MADALPNGFLDATADQADGVLTPELEGVEVRLIGPLLLPPLPSAVPHTLLAAAFPYEFVAARFSTIGGPLFKMEGLAPRFE